MEKTDAFHWRPVAHGIPVLFPPNRYDDELYNIDTKPKQTYAPQITEDMALRYLETLGYQIPDTRINT